MLVLGWGDLLSVGGDLLSVLLVSLMALQLALVERKPFRPCFTYDHKRNFSRVLEMDET